MLHALSRLTLPKMTQHLAPPPVQCFSPVLSGSLLARLGTKPFKRLGEEDGEVGAITVNIPVIGWLT